MRALGASCSYDDERSSHLCSRIDGVCVVERGFGEPCGRPGDRESDNCSVLSPLGTSSAPGTCVLAAFSACVPGDDAQCPFREETSVSPLCARPCHIGDGQAQCPSGSSCFGTDPSFCRWSCTTIEDGREVALPDACAEGVEWVDRFRTRPPDSFTRFVGFPG